MFTPQNRFGRQGAAYAATWLTDVGESDGKRIDQVISLRYPAYAVRHPRHVCWLLHTMREYYDLWPAFRGRAVLEEPSQGRTRRRVVHAADRRLLSSSRLARLCVISSAVQRRLARRPAARLGGAAPAAPCAGYRCDGYSDEFLRRLATDAAEASRPRHPRPGGARRQRMPDRHCRHRPSRTRRCARWRVRVGVNDRVRFLGRLDEEELVAAFARCRAVVFTPKDEDYGFVTAEAFASGKAVVTCTDAGGPTDLVRDGQEGFVTDPTPTAIAAAMRRLIDEPALCQVMGDRARAAAAGLTWPHVVERLVVV